MTGGWSSASGTWNNLKEIASILGALDKKKVTKIQAVKVKKDLRASERFELTGKSGRDRLLAGRQRAKT